MVDYICKKCGKKVMYCDEIRHKDLIDSGLCGYCKYMRDYPEPVKRK